MLVSLVLFINIFCLFVVAVFVFQCHISGVVCQCHCVVCVCVCVCITVRVLPWCQCECVCVLVVVVVVVVFVPIVTCFTQLLELQM